MKNEWEKEEERKHREAVKREAIDTLWDVGLLIPEIAIAVSKSQKYVRATVWGIKENER